MKLVAALAAQAAKAATVQVKEPRREAGTPAAQPLALPEPLALPIAHSAMLLDCAGEKRSRDVFTGTSDSEGEAGEQQEEEADEEVAGAEEDSVAVWGGPLIVLVAPKKSKKPAAAQK